jgi:hypothetical protein
MLPTCLFYRTNPSSKLRIPLSSTYG